jgi:hypothetical protein
MYQTTRYHIKSYSNYFFVSNNDLYTDLLICGLFNDACSSSDSVVLKTTTINECRIEKVVENSGCDLVWDAIEEFNWKYWEAPLHTSG